MFIILRVKIIVLIAKNIRDTALAKSDNII